MRTKLLIGLIVALAWCVLTSSGLSQAMRLSDYLREGGFSPRRESDDVQIPPLPGKLGNLVKAGDAAVRKKQYDQAISSYSAALQMNSDARTAAFIYDERAYAYLEKKDFARVIADENEAIQSDSRFHRAYLNRGVAYFGRHEIEKAVSDFTAAIRYKSDYALAYYNRGYAQGISGQYQQAIRDFSDAIRLAPDYVEALYNRGAAYYATRNYNASASDLVKAAKIDPSNAEILTALGWLKATCLQDSLRNGKEATEMAAKACQLTKWNNANCIDVLAAAYAESGDFENALKYQEQALNAKGASPSMRKYMQQRLALYRDRKPWRDKPLIAQ